jgi:cellulose synthase/poly-beta-1,6-N-acetylglucosamine synthase-like glycosyltransferase
MNWMLSISRVGETLAWGVALLWVWKAVTALRGMPRVPNLVRPEYDVRPAGEPWVTVIVPARNEATHIAGCLKSLVAQDYANLRVVAIDDRSTDATGAIMEDFEREHTGRLGVLHVAELPAGWLGKTHAMALGARHAIATHEPQFLLFSDADVLFHPEAIRRSLAQAVATRADHFVTAPTPILKTAGEAALLGFIQMLSLWAAQPWRVADPAAKRDAIGIGAFNLLRTTAYLELGGFDALRMQILEDLTLARRVKELGLRQRIAFAPGMVSLHWAAGAMGVVNVMTKNLFAVFSFRPMALLVACVWLTAFFLAPLVGLGFAGTRVPSILTLAAIGALYWLSQRFSRIPAWTALAFPLSVALFVYSMLRSMVVTLRAGGVTWRGTFYPLAELRKNVVSLR